MPMYLKRSRVLKALADAARVGSFGEAEARLGAVRLNIVVGADQIGTSAGQAAVLTAVTTARKCFGRVTLVATGNAPLVATLPIRPYRNRGRQPPWGYYYVEAGCERHSHGPHRHLHKKRWMEPALLVGSMAQRGSRL